MRMRTIAALALALAAGCSQQEEQQQGAVQFTEQPQQAQAQTQQLQRPGFVNTNPGANAPVSQAALPQPQIRPLPSYGDPRPAQPMPQGTVAGVYARPAARAATPIVIPPSPAMTPPATLIVQSHLNMVKPDPRCEPFRGQITAAGGAGALDAATISRFVQILQSADASGCVKS
jgi:hypothetical protein